MGAWGVGPFENDTASDWLSLHRFATISDFEAREICDKAIEAGLRAPLRTTEEMAALRTAQQEMMARLRGGKKRRNGTTVPKPVKLKRVPSPGRKLRRLAWRHINNVEIMCVALGIAAGRGFKYTNAQIIEACERVHQLDTEMGWNDDAVAPRKKMIILLEHALLAASNGHHDSRCAFLKKMEQLERRHCRARRKRWKAKRVKRRKRHKPKRRGKS